MADLVTAMEGVLALKEAQQSFWDMFSLRCWLGHGEKTVVFISL